MGNQISSRPAGIFREQHACVIRVEDFAAMVDWYTGVLEIEPVRIIPDISMAILNLPGPSYLCLYQPPGEVPRILEEELPKCLVNWRVDDLTATREKLLAKGVKCGEVMGGEGLEVFSFFDPEGTRHDCCAYDERWLPEK